ncbi:SGNH/GDSL hydrolase family protein [Ralstonia flaminis]|jgi:acyl-CoA thioesterase-1|uniref:SGNH hydrolase-type esterase domain-containing protein n=1 Tax=Ralstonia flaminis TaxID=3058597 RepID=A0ABN9JF18_9RALS|nr:GDSL-type esterase/lipase family protein [Ralstonia sp. LMG 18101]CAJ0809731.1 hypothetical protein LMG18101_00653 [Ralstonia sp. LMG 18101]
MNLMRGWMLVVALLCASEGWAQTTPSPCQAGADAKPCDAQVGRVIHIVAFGGSNTYGKNLPRGDAYPAQLERLLRSDGFDVEVRNEGTNGQTTAEALSRVDAAVPEGTDIVIFQPGGNDTRYNARRPLASRGNTEDNIVAVVQRLQARKIGVIVSGNAAKQQAVAPLGVPTVDELSHLAPLEEYQVDGQHLTPKGYGVVAQALRPIVEQLIRQRLAAP